MAGSVRYFVAGTALALITGGVSAQVAAPAPGSGDSTAISSSNRDTNAQYNRLIGATDAKPSKGDTRSARKSTPVAATAADITVGSSLRDLNGVPIGTISQIDPDGVVVDTGTTKIKVPALGFGKDSEGLVLNLTAARFNELIAKAHAAH